MDLTNARRAPVEEYPTPTPQEAAFWEYLFGAVDGPRGEHPGMFGRQVHPGWRPREPLAEDHPGYPGPTPLDRYGPGEPWVPGIQDTPTDPQPSIEGMFRPPNFPTQREMAMINKFATPRMPKQSLPGPKPQESVAAPGVSFMPEQQPLSIPRLSPEQVAQQLIPILPPQGTDSQMQQQLQDLGRLRQGGFTLDLQNPKQLLQYNRTF